jgi:hypothetical protein
MAGCDVSYEENGGGDVFSVGLCVVGKKLLVTFI